jgi:hypothetical protein
MLNSGRFEKINKGGILQVVPSRARSGYISLKRHPKATGGRTTFEAKMEGSKANSFKSPAGGGTFHGRQETRDDRQVPAR